MRLFRRRSVPEAVSAVPLPPGERRTAWALAAQGEPVVAVDGGLLLPGRELLRWGGIETATWARPHLLVREVAEVSGHGPEHRLELDDEGDLPAVVRDRVTASVAWSSHTRLTPHGGVRVVGRRDPASEVLAWQLVFDEGLDPSDPVLRARAEEVLEGARRSIG
jgi:hypothetical protein